MILVLSVKVTLRQLLIQETLNKVGSTVSVVKISVMVATMKAASSKTCSKVKVSS